MPLLRVRRVLDPESEENRESSISCPNLSEKTPDPGRAQDEAEEIDEPDDAFHGKHRWDKHASWTGDEVKKLVRKTDLRILLPICLIFIGIQIDSSNIANVLTDNFYADTGFNDDILNQATFVCRIGVLLSEIPSQLLVLKFGFRRVFPILIILWGIVSASQAFVQGKGVWLTQRFLVGIFLGGWFPGMIHFISMFYTGPELGIRLSLVFAANDVSDILGNLSAAGILKMRGIGGKPGWYWLFLIDGISTIVLGILSFLYLPLSPTSTKTVLRRSPIFTDREEVVMVNRTLRDAPTKGQSDVLFSITWNDIKATCSDRSLWILSSIGFFALIVTSPVALYQSNTLRRFGFPTLETNLLLVVHDVTSLTFTILLALSSRYFKERTWHCIFGEFFLVPFFAALIAFPRDVSKWAMFAMTSMITGRPGYAGIAIAWLSEASFSIKKSGVAIAIRCMLSIVGLILGSFVYQPSDGPHYYKANKGLVVVSFFLCCLFFTQQQIYKRVNKARAKQWDEMTPSEQAAYQHVTKRLDLDANTRIDFQYPM